MGTYTHTKTGELRRLRELVEGGRSFAGAARDLRRSRGWASKWCNTLKIKSSFRVDRSRFRTATSEKKTPGIGAGRSVGVVEIDR